MNRQHIGWTVAGWVFAVMLTLLAAVMLTLLASGIAFLGVCWGGFAIHSQVSPAPRSVEPMYGSIETDIARLLIWGFVGGVIAIIVFIAVMSLTVSHMAKRAAEEKNKQGASAFKGNRL